MAKKKAASEPAVKLLETPASAKVTVFMLKDRGSNNRGELALFSKDMAAAMISKGIACPVDANNNPVQPSVKHKAKPTETDDSSVVLDDPDQGKFNPFVLDGLTIELANVLAKSDLNDPDDVRAFIQAGGDLSLIEGVEEADAAQLKQLYTEAE